MVKRIISGLSAVAILLFVLYLIDGVGLPLTNYVLGFLMLIGLYEIYKPFGFIKRMPLALVGFALGLTLIFGNLNNAGFVISIICIYMLLMFVLAVCYHKTIKFSDICILLFTTLYVSLGIAHLRLLKEMSFGTVMLVLVCISAFFTDTGAFFTGCFMGKHKLLPEISPKKTVEGAVGGTVTAAVGAVIFYFVIPLIFKGIEINLANTVIITVIGSLAGQIGDLSASMIKRELGIKDYGEIMPGHGGILDRLDSLLFVAPVVFYLSKLFPVYFVI